MMHAEGGSVEDLTNHYNSALTTVLDKHAPARVKMVTIRPKQPWFSDDLSRAKCEKRKWEWKWTDTNLAVHYDLFKTARTKFNNMLLQAKKDYYNNLIALLCSLLTKYVRYAMSCQISPDTS